MKALTRDRKLKIKNAIYVFRVPAETSLDAMDIIKTGRLLMFKSGMKPSVDVNGKILGKAGCCWNRIEPIEIEPNVEIHNLIACSLERTRNLIEAEEKNPGSKLPRLAVVKFQKEVIQRDDSVPRYFIPAIAYCANCHEPIQGTHTLHINNNGKVGSMEPFQPDGDIEAVPHSNGSKKWLHSACAAKSILEESRQAYIPENVTWEDVIKAGEEVTKEAFGLEKKSTLKETLLELLIEPTVNSEFARGAAYMYILMSKGE